MFQKNDFWKFKKIGKHFNIFVYLIKIPCQSKEFPLSKQFPSFSPTPPFLEKIFYLHRYSQIWRTQLPLHKGEGRKVPTM